MHFMDTGFIYTQIGDETGFRGVKLGPKDRVTLWMITLVKYKNLNSHLYLSADLILLAGRV